MQITRDAEVHEEQDWEKSSDVFNCYKHHCCLHLNTTTNSPVQQVNFPYKQKWEWKWIKSPLNLYQEQKNIIIK